VYGWKAQKSMCVLLLNMHRRKTVMMFERELWPSRSG
jgi:hypothetical protein